MRILLLLSVLVLATILAGCSDNPTQPKPLDKQYTVYIVSQGIPQEYYGVHPESGIIDTFALPYYCRRALVVSPDGKLLYIPTSAAVQVVNSETKADVATIPYRAFSGLAISRDNKRLALLGTEGLKMYAIPGYSEIYRDSLMSDISFNQSGTALYYLRADSDYSIVCRLDLTTMAETRHPLGFKYVFQMRPSRDETKWFLYSWTGRYDSFKFEVYDPTADSVTFREYLSPGQGYLDLSPDGRYVLFNNPGSPMQDIYGTSDFTVFDVARNRIKMVVTTIGAKNGLDPDWMAIGGFAQTPDNRWIVTIGAGVPAFLVFDRTAWEIVRYFDMPRGILTLACQQAE